LSKTQVKSAGAQIGSPNTQATRAVAQGEIAQDLSETSCGSTEIHPNGCDAVSMGGKRRHQAFKECGGEVESC